MYIHILLVTPCLLTRIREFIHMQQRNTTLGLRPMLSVDKFPYPRKQTRGNEFMPCLNNIYDILKRFRSFKIPDITLIWPKSPHKHSVTWSYPSGKKNGRRSESPLWRHQWLSFCLYSSRWWRPMWDTPLYFTGVDQSEARISIEHGLNMYMYTIFLLCDPFLHQWLK